MNEWMNLWMNAIKNTLKENVFKSGKGVSIRLNS